jgi:hypothetical protein
MDGKKRHFGAQQKIQRIFCALKFLEGIFWCSRTKYTNGIYSMVLDTAKEAYMEENLISEQKTENLNVMNLDRELISKFGNAVFLCPETVSVIMRVDFKDGSSVGFQKDKEIGEGLLINN